MKRYSLWRELVNRLEASQPRSAYSPEALVASEMLLAVRLGLGGSTRGMIEERLAFLDGRILSKSYFYVSWRWTRGVQDQTFSIPAPASSKAKQRRLPLLYAVVAIDNWIIAQQQLHAFLFIGADRETSRQFVDWLGDGSRLAVGLSGEDHVFLGPSDLRITVQDVFDGLILFEQLVWAIRDVRQQFATLKLQPSDLDEHFAIVTQHLDELTAFYRDITGRLSAEVSTLSDGVAPTTSNETLDALKSLGLSRGVVPGVAVMADWS